MSRLSLAIAASLVSFSALAHAGTFGGWRYTAPVGYAAEVAPDHVTLTKQTGSTFCSLTLSAVRAIDGPLDKEAALEWSNVVTQSFSATVTRRARKQLGNGTAIRTTTATLTAADGSTYSAIHYVVMPPGMIGSTLLISSNPASLRRCEPGANAFVATLAIDWSSPKFTDPEARIETPIGSWGSIGPTSRQYTFGADGTYRFHSEEPVRNGTRVIDETGTYKWLGNQLTLVPTRIDAAITNDGVTRPGGKVRLAKTTYTWSKRYVPATNEWLIVLTPRTATERDGKSATGTFQYSDHVAPEWNAASGPGV